MKAHLNRICTPIFPYGNNVCMCIVNCQLGCKFLVLVMMYACALSTRLRIFGLFFEFQGAQLVYYSGMFYLKETILMLKCNASSAN